MSGEELLGRDEILAAANQTELATDDVAVPELGGRKVRVREMSGAMRSRVEAAMATVKMGKGDTRLLERSTAQILAACIVDENNRPILKEPDAKRLVDRNPRAAFRLRERIFGLSAIDEEDMEALAEGFSDGPSDDSTSG